MTGPLDELREALTILARSGIDLGVGDTRWLSSDLVFAALDAFAAAHPGLRDDTRTCICCGKAYDPRDCYQWVLNRWLYCAACGDRESTGEPCPACAKEATP